MMDTNFNFNCSKCKSKLKSEVYILQCMHNLCGSCIESIQENTALICALCKTTTNKDGVVRNHFIEKIINYQNLNNNGHIEKINCEICLPEIITAEKYCIECEQYFCVKCATSHVKSKQCMNHNIVDNNDINQKENYLNEIFESSKPIITNKLREINNLIQSQYLERETNKKIELNFIAKVNSIKTEIYEQAKQFRESIDDMQENLINNLMEYKNKYIKIINKNYEEISEYISELDNFKTYLECAVKNGSKFEIFKIKKELDLNKWIESMRPSNCAIIDLSYKKSTFDVNMFNCKKLFGQLQDSKIFKLRNEVTSSCVINNYLYAMDDNNKCIDIYDIDSSTFQSSIDCKKYIQRNNSLIIEVLNNLFLYCDYLKKKKLKTIIYKYNTLEFVKWKTIERCRLSSTSHGTILALTLNNWKVTEFSIDGLQLSTFTAPNLSKKMFAQHLQTEKVVVTSHGHLKCLISPLDDQGKFIESSSKNRNNLIKQCFVGENKIFVLDCNIGLITVLSSDLKQIDKFTIPNALGISYDRQNNKIIVITKNHIEYFNNKY